MKKYQNSNKPLTQVILDETGLDLTGLENGRLLTITHEIVEKAKSTPLINHHRKIIDYCEWIPNLASHGPLPADCKWHIAQVYVHLNSEDKEYVQKRLAEIKTNSQQ